MKLNEAQLRKIIREELLKEMDGMEPKEDEGLHLGAIATGLSVPAAAGLANAVVAYIQTHPEIAEKVASFLKLLGVSLAEE
jgi:hypothetical protein